MTNNAAKRRIWLTATAAIIAVALLLSCAFAAFLYTRTGENPGENTVAGEGSATDDNALLNAQYGYGGRRPGDTAPSGSYVKTIANATELEDFLNSSTYTYGLLTHSFTIGNEVKPSLNRTLAEGKTLDGNGYTITTYFTETAALDCRRVDGGLTSDWYKSWFTFQQNGTGNAVDIGNGLSAFGVSNIVSVNRGTIKNLSVAVSGGTDAKAVVTAPEGYDGNIGMGVVAGINFGTVENCVSTINVTYGFYGSPVQAWSNTASNSNNKILSRQGLVAVGGVVGINKGTILNTQVNQNADLGTYRPVYTVEYDWNNKETSAIYNDNIGSGIVGGVAGLNDGGTVNGVDYNSTAGKICNQNNHVANSYTGLIVGLANLQNAKGGEAVRFNVGYYSSGAIQSGGSLPVAAGSVQNIQYNTHSGFSAATEAYAYSGTRGGFMVINNDGWTPTGSYVGLIGGRVSTNSSVAEKIVTGGISFDANKYAFRAWGTSELNSTLAFADNTMPLLGYGTTSNVNSNHYQNLYVAARLAGQDRESNQSQDFSNDSVFLSLAQVSYIWDSYVNSEGTVVSRVLYNVNFDNITDLAGKGYSVYKQTGSVQGVSGSQIAGSDDYTAGSLTNGGRIEWTAGYAPQWTLMLYSLRINDFTSLSHFEAFAKTSQGANNEYFAYAFADAVMLTSTNTLTSPSLTGDKVLKSWKTIDGNGNGIVIYNASGTATSGYASQIGGLSLAGISDFISINEGTIKNLTLNYTSSSRDTISASGNVAYGRVAGINLGTINNVNVNNTGAYGDGTQTKLSTTGSTAAVGLAVGANAGTIDTMHTIMRQSVSASASSLAFAGGAVGVNSGGTIRNVIVDGISAATLSATATSGESYAGGVLGAGSNYGSVGVGGMTLTAPSGGSPFSNWTFVGKQTIQTQGSYAGMLAGRVVGAANKADNGNSDDYMLKNMVVMMPQTETATGWFTGTAGRMSLLGRASGSEAATGFIATDLVSGYYIYIDDASTSYISRIYEDYNASKSGSGINAIFKTDVFNGSSAVRSVNAITMHTEYMSADAAAQISFTANLNSETQSVFIPSAVAGSLSVPVTEGNDGNYAPAVKLYYDYDVNLSQSASDADTSMSKTSLEAFVSGDASSASGVGTHKILAAGAGGATLTSDVFVSVTIAADFVKTRGLDGGGHTVIYSGGAIGGTTYGFDSDSLTAAGVLASVNSSTISNVNVAMNVSSTTNMGGAFAFGGAVGVNLGTLTGVTVSLGGNFNLSGGGVSFVGGAVGINRGVADGTRVALSGSVAATNSGGTLMALGGVIGLQDSASLSDVQTTGYGGSLTAAGNSLVGGVIGLANLSDGDTLAGITATKTTLENIANAAYGMNITALNGYKGLIAGSVSEGAVRDGALSGIAALYPEDIADYVVPWTTDTVNVFSMYGYGTAGDLDGVLFSVKDLSADGKAEFLTDRTISVNGDLKSFTFDKTQFTSALESLTFTATYYYYDESGILTTDGSYTGVPTLSGSVYTTSLDREYAGGNSFVPVLEVLVDYNVNIYNAENQRLVDFMRGEGEGVYAGAHKAVLATNASFALDGSNAAQRSVSLDGKVLIGSSGNVIAVSGNIPVTEYDGITAAGGFFAVNRADVMNVTVTSAGATVDASVYGAAFGINYGELSNVNVSLSGTHTVNADNAYVGGAIGFNNENLSNVCVTYANAVLNAAASTAAVGGAVGKQNGAVLTDVGTTGAGATLTASGGTGYIGGVIGIINTGADNTADVTGENLEPSVLSGVYAGAYPSSLSGGYTGLIAGAAGNIRSGGITGAAAHYYESGNSEGIRGIPWFTTSAADISMYGYNVSASAENATGVLLKISDYSDDGAADFVSSRVLTSTAGSAVFTVPLTAFSGVRDNSVNIRVTYNTYSGDGVSSVVTDQSDRGVSGDYSYTVADAYLNGTGDFVPTIDFFVTYSVDINSGTESDWNNDYGIYQSKLYCFIDGTGENQLYAGAQTGYITEDLLIDKPMNGFVTMRAEKTLEGNGHTLMLSWVGSYDGNYVLQQNDRTSDNATSGSGGYVGVEVGGKTVGAAGGLIAVNYGTVRNFNIVHRNYSTLTGTYAFTFTENVAAGVLAGVNFGSIENVVYDNATASGTVKIVVENQAEVIFGGILGANAESATAENLSLTKSSSDNVSGTGKGIYGGVIGANYGNAQHISVTAGTEISQNDYMSRLDSDPAAQTDYIAASSLTVWGAVIGYNAGDLSDASMLAHVNYGVNATGGGNLAAGGILGMNDGGSADRLKATGWGGFFVYSATIMSVSRYSVFVGGLIGAMNADGAAAIGFINFENAEAATLSGSVFALSGGMVTMMSKGAGYARYGYVTGVLAADYQSVPAGAVSNTFWFIADKLQSVEGDDAEQLPVFHGGNSAYPTYISAFGMATANWNASANEAAFATGSYGFTLVDSDDNPINYLTMDASVNNGTLTLDVHKPAGGAFVGIPDFLPEVTGSDVSSASKGTVGAGGSSTQTLTVSNSGNTGTGYVTFSFESGVYALTDNAHVQDMILSFLSTKPVGTTSDSQGNLYTNYYSYTTVDGEMSRSLDNAFYRVYQIWSGATDMTLSGNNKVVTIKATPSQPLILGKGKTFDGGQDRGYSVVVESAFANNIADYTFGDLDGVKQKYLVVSEFLTINYGTFTNTSIQLSGTDGGHDISRNALDVIANASNTGIDTSELTGFIYGMLVGINEGTISECADYSFDRTITLDSNAGSQYNSIFGGMVGAQSGENALIKNIGHITFGTAERAGGITMSGSANLVAAGGVVGIAIQGRIENVGVTLTANSFLSVTAAHNAATVGGVVGDLRGELSDVVFESEYQSVMKISGTNTNGTAALANLVGIVNTFSDSSEQAAIEKAKVTGVGYLYNGIDESGIVTTSSTKLYTAGVVALGSNYGALTAQSDDTTVKELVAAYGEIRPARLDSVYIDFEGYVRAKANTRVGMITARILDGVKSDDGVVATEMNVNYDNLKNLVWQTACEGDNLWTTNVNYADYSAAFNTNTAVAILGYAPVTIDSQNTDIRGAGMRLWLTNNLYSARLSTSDMVTSWTGLGQLSAAISGSLRWKSLESALMYYDESGESLSERFKTIESLGTQGAASSVIVSVDVVTALSKIKSSANTFSNGIYMLRVTYNEVYIYDAKQLMTFMSAGADTTQGLSSTDSLYSSYANANIGIIANDLEVNYATQGTGDKAGHYYTTAVTMRADKILEGNGNNVTITTSGNIHSAVIDDKGNTPAGALLSGEYYWDYIGGMNTLSSADLNQMDTQYSIGIRAGGLFLGRNLGTIQNIDFSLPNSVTIDNIDYAKWFDVINQDSWREYGTSLYVGIVTAVNAGTIDNCTLTLGNNVKVNGIRKSASGPQLQKGYINELTYKVNTMSVNGGFAGLMYGTSSAPSYISNCTVNLSDGSEIRAESQVSSFSWSPRKDSVYAYAGGVVGWLTSDSTVYNVTINGTGTMTAWGELDMGGKSDGFSDGDKVTSAGAIVGLNSDHSTYTISNNPDEFGLIDGVICNWNGAAYFLSTGNNNIFYSSSGRVNYYVGAQLAGVAEQNTLNNIYFMYGIDQYKTFHQDNWYYGSDVATRQANADFADKFDYISSRAVELLENDSFPYSAIYAIVRKPGGNPSLTEVAYRNADGTVSLNTEDKVVDGVTIPAFTFENYANYQEAIDGSTISGATNFSLYVAEGTTFYVANSYFPRITATMDSGGDKNMDYVGARAAAMMTSNGSADWNNIFKPNNVYIYEVAFGVDESNGTQIDMNDPDASAYLSFQTKSITSDVAVNISLKTDNMGAQFVWKITESWHHEDGSTSKSESTYYDNVTSLEQAKENNNFVRIFDRDNNGADFMFTYVMGMAIKIAMDESRYYYNEEEGVFYDNMAKIYDGNDIEDPELYYADEEGNPINRPDLGLTTVKASAMKALYYKEGTTSPVGYSNTESAGAYRVRINFSTEGGENSKVNTANRTIMFSDLNFIDIYTVVLPAGVTGNNVSVSKTYDGTVNYNDSVTDFGSNLVGNDVVHLSEGKYVNADAGSGNIFRATYEEFTFLYQKDGVIEEKTIFVFVGSDMTGNYAPVTAALGVTGGSTALTDGNLSKYYTSAPVMLYYGEIHKKQITLADVDLNMFGREFIEGGVNPPIEYDAMTVYNTEAFRSGSTILSNTLSLSADKKYMIMQGYAAGETVEFYISFLASGSSVFEESVKNYGTYNVYINIQDSTNFVFYTNNQQAERMNVGQLSITSYALQKANVKYVVSGDLSKIFDNTGNLTFSFNPDNLKIIAQNGYEVGKDEYTLTVGAMYTTAKGSSVQVSAKDVGEYDVYFKISNFDCPLGNYTLEDMTVSFVDPAGKEISYFVLPKEIEFSAVTKEFDNTKAADPSVAQYTYASGKAPINGTNDVFDISYVTLDTGAGLSVVFNDTKDITLGGVTYTTVSVTEGSNKGTNNYYTQSTTFAKGNITPVKVTVEKVSMIYNNGVIVNYRNEGTEVVIKDGSGRQIDIYPAAQFVNKNAGTNKQVNFTTTNMTIAGENYRVLENSIYVTPAAPESGEKFAGNYYVANASYFYGEIIKNTLSLSDITGNISVMHTNGAVTVSGTEYDFVTQLSGKSYVYRYGYYIGFEIDPTATIIEGDLLSDHVTVTVTHTGSLENGYAGTYTLELEIVGGDYEWDSDVTTSARRVENFKISKQTLKAGNFSAYLANTVLAYKRDPEGTTVDPQLTANDLYGRQFSTGRTLSLLTNTNENFRGDYYNGSHLDVGDYRVYVTPVFTGDDRYNYEYSGSGKEVNFSVIPYEIVSISVSKTFDNNTSFTTQGNEAKFSMNVLDTFTPGGSFGNKAVGTSKTVNLTTVTTTINNTTYKLLIDADTGKATNQTYRTATGVINKYVISASEFNSYILGWIKDLTTRQQTSLKGEGAQLEYRSDAEAGYKAEHFLFETAGMKFGFTTARAATSVQIMQGGSSVTTLDFTIIVSDGSKTYTFAPGDTVSSYVLPVGEYTVTLMLSNVSFELGAGTGNGTFTITKQEISGGDASGSANVFITLNDEFSYVYGEGGYNLPTVEDEKFGYTVSIIDKYTGKVGATFTNADAIIGVVEYTTAADSTEFLTTLAGPLYVGEYYVWASGFSEELGNYSIASSARVPVYPAGTPVPTVPEEGGEESGEEEGGDEGGVIVIPSLPVETAYTILPRALNITEISKTYDGTVSFDGATMISDALAEDGITAQSITGEYESPNANYDSTGANYIDGNKGSDYLLISVVQKDIGGTVYNMLSESGIEGNYCVIGEASAGIVSVSGAKIMRKAVASDELTLESDTFETVYGSGENPVLPEVTANLGSGTEIVAYTASNVVYKQAGEVVAAPTEVGGYEMYLTGIAFDNYEVAGLSTVLVNAGRNVEEGGNGGEEGSESGSGETGGEGEEEPEVYTYYIVPKEVVISGVVKIYDATDGLVYYGEDEEGFSAEVTITDTEGNAIEDEEGNPVILRLQAKMADALVGKGKDVLADFTPFGYYLNFDVAAPVMYYRLLTVGEDGTANVQSNYCLTVSDTVILPVQFDEDYVPDPELGYDDTPYINNDLVYQMTLTGAGTVVPAPLDVNGVNKVYDTTHEIVGGTLGGWLQGDEGLVPADWRYDDKNAGEDKTIGISTDGTAYVYGGVTYYAIYVLSGGEKVLSNYGVAADDLATVEETVTSEDGSETTVQINYAVIDGIGVITPYTLTEDNFVYVSVAGVMNTEYNSSKTYSSGDVQLTVSALGFTAAAINAGGTLTVTFDNGDVITFTASLAGGNVVSDAGRYPLSVTVAEVGNYNMPSGYSATFVISPQVLSRVFVTTGSIEKEYDGTGDLPAYSTDGWTIAAIDRQGKVIDPSVFESVDLSGARIVFKTWNEDEGVYEYFVPVNAVADTDQGYQMYVTGFALDGGNYIFDQTSDAYACSTFESEQAAYEYAYYRITPRIVTLSDGAFDSKLFDGAYSLKVSGGVDGETVVIGDASGLNASLAGEYGTIQIKPYVRGVDTDDTALNQESGAGNYILYYGGEPVTAETVITVENYTVTTADILVAERANGRYEIGISGLKGLDFLFAKSDDVSGEAADRIVSRLESGQIWTGGSIDTSSDFAKLNEAVFDVFGIYLNNNPSAVIPASTEYYCADNFLYEEQDGAYVLRFTFTGISGYDDATATDRYTFAVKGNTDDVRSTNVSTTSSELESGQLTAPTAAAGIAVSDVGELRDAIRQNKDFYLTRSIYGADLSDVSATEFSGTFDGRGYTLSITGGAVSKQNATGMLVAVNNGTIRNLVVKLMPMAELSGVSVGALVGVNNGEISNVSVELISAITITGATNAGGIAGVNNDTGVIENVSFVYSADVNAAGAAWGSVAGINSGTLDRVAVRVNESFGARDYTVTAASASYVAGVADGTVSGVIVAVPEGRLVGVNALTNGGSATVADVYSYVAADGAGTALKLLEPYPEGYIGYYFATADDYTTDGMLHNELTAAGEYNKSYYVDYSAGAGYIAVEAIAPYNRFIWDGYGISYRTPFGDSNVGSSLSRIVALFAAGDIAAQFDGTTVVTSGVNAFTVAIGVRGGNVEVDGDVETSIKEVVYTGVAQVYSVNITVTSGGVSETKTLSVGGTEAGYYSKASLEGIIGGGAGGETIGDVTYDAGSRTEYTFSGEGTKVANGIALVIYPRQTDADEVSAIKYYDTTPDGVLTVKDGDKTAGTIGGSYYDGANVLSSQVATAEKFGFADFATLTRSVLSKDGVLYAVVQKVSGEGDNVVVTYETEAIKIGTDELATEMTVSTTVGQYTSHELMLAYSRLADENYARSVLSEEQLEGFEFVRVYNLTADLSAASDGVSFGNDVSYRPVLGGENGGNYSLYSAAWIAPSDMTIGANEGEFASERYAMTVSGAILPVDLGIYADYTVGADQSYNSAMLDPQAVSDGKVTITQQQAAELGISAENYAKLVAEAESGISVTFGSDFFEELAAQGVLEKRADGKYYSTSAYAVYGTAQLPEKADGGNFVVTMRNAVMTLRYFGTTIKDGAAYYTLTSTDDYYKWIDNEAGEADYYAIDMLLTTDVDFGGKTTDMLAWRDKEGNVVGYKGVFDGNGYAITGMIIDRAGSAALFERIDEGAVVRDLTVADTIVIATGDRATAGGIAVDNYGTIENCAFEGVLSAGDRGAAQSVIGGIAATNYGTISGGMSVGRVYSDAADSAVEGIAANAESEGSVGTSEGVSLTESTIGYGEGRTEETVVERTDGTAADWQDEDILPVIKAYVFDDRYVKVDTDGLFVTDNFYKLNAVDKLFGWVGADAVTSATQKGFYGTLTIGG